MVFPFAVEVPSLANIAVSLGVGVSAKTEDFDAMLPSDTLEGKL
jgi:hypothetical protein